MACCRGCRLPPGRTLSTSGPRGAQRDVCPLQQRSASGFPPGRRQGAGGAPAGRRQAASSRRTCVARCRSPRTAQPLAGASVQGRCCAGRPLPRSRNILPQSATCRPRQSVHFIRGTEVASEARGGCAYAPRLVAAEILTVVGGCVPNRKVCPCTLALLCTHGCTGDPRRWHRRGFGWPPAGSAQAPVLHPCVQRRAAVRAVSNPGHLPVSATSPPPDRVNVEPDSRPIKPTAITVRVE